MDSQNNNSETAKANRGGGVNTYLVITLVILLVGVIVYLLSIINNNRYFLVVNNNQLHVERGYFFPTGSGEYKPTDKSLVALYAPLEIPAGEHLPQRSSFDNLAELDRRLFTLISGWAHKSLQGNGEHDFERAIYYVDRARKLSGLTDEQQRELNILRGDLAYRDGRRLIQAAIGNLQQALKAFRQASDLGTSRPIEIEEWVTELEKRLQDYKLGADKGTPAELILFAPKAPVPVEQPQPQPQPQVIRIIPVNNSDSESGMAAGAATKAEDENGAAAVQVNDAPAAVSGPVAAPAEAVPVAGEPARAEKPVEPAPNMGLSGNPLNDNPHAGKLTL